MELSWHQMDIECPPYIPNRTFANDFPTLLATMAEVQIETELENMTEEHVKHQQKTFYGSVVLRLLRSCPGPSGPSTGAVDCPGPWPYCSGLLRAFVSLFWTTQGLRLAVLDYPSINQNVTNEQLDYPDI